MQRKRVNVEFAQQYFDFLLGEIEKGEVFEIENEGKVVLLVPYEDHIAAMEELREIKDESSD